ncbi:mRNA-binding ribosome synthesis protein nop7, partial [Coelomomyces lativittatus]
KDIQFLLHEPLLQKLRDWKAYAKKLTKFREKKEWDLLEEWTKKEPQFKLDHIIRERYPTFQDALRELDDAFSMICLFSTLPQVGRHVTPEFILGCQQKKQHFLHYIAHFHRLKKAFVSIKGIYFQADIQGQMVTWVMPHPFAPTIPKDVDFKILLSFAQLYDALVGFVLFKLYKDVQWRYPPTTLVTAMTTKTSDGSITSSESTTEPASLLSNETTTVNASPLLTLTTAPLTTTTTTTTTRTTATLDTFVKLKPTASDTQTLPFTHTSPLLFQGLVFYLSRETHVEVLALIIKSLGGHVGWDETSTTDHPSPFPVTYPGITHHVVDRPTLPKLSLPTSRVYVQPQYVFDCLNQSQRLPVQPTSKSLFSYAPGKKLPPHLSPFVNTSDTWTYQPNQDQSSSFSSFTSTSPTTTTSTSSFNTESTKNQKASSTLATMMMPKNHQRLYQRIIRTRLHKQKKIMKLQQKRDVIEKLKARCGRSSNV